MEVINKTEYCKYCGKLVEYGYFGKSEEYCSLNCAIQDLELVFRTTRKIETCEQCGEKIQKGVIACRPKNNKDLWFHGMDDALLYFEVI